MDLRLEEKILEKRLQNYYFEEERIQKKLRNKEISQGKREKLEFRLKDIQERLIPSTIRILT